MGMARVIDDDDQPLDDERRRVAITLRIEGEILPERLQLAEMMLDVCSRRRLLDGRKKPLRALAESATIAPHRLETWLVTDITPDYSSIEKLATETKIPARAWLDAIVDSGSLPQGTVGISPGDRAVLEAIGGLDDAEKYEVARTLELLKRGREGRSHS